MPPFTVENKDFPGRDVALTSVSLNSNKYIVHLSLLKHVDL